MIGDIEAFKLEGKGHFFDSSETYNWTDIYIENNGKVFTIILKNLDNIKEVDNIYKNMVSTFEILD